MANAIELNDSNFDQEVKQSDIPVLVDFYAVWCGPCRKQLPIVDELAGDFSGKAKITKINVDEGSAKSSEFTVSSIPALLVFKGGHVVDRLTGLHSKEQLASILNKHL